MGPLTRAGSVQFPGDERKAIEDLSALYSFYCDTRQYQCLANLFCEDGIFDETAVGATRISCGPTEIFNQITDFQDQLGPCIHICSNHLISSICGSSASGTCHVLAEGTISLDSRSNTFKVGGIYYDEYRKDAGQWLFKSRVLKLLIPYALTPVVS